MKIIQRTIATKREGRVLAFFTLVELLVVMAILTLLMTMVLKAAANVRKQAHRIQCISNLRQIGISLFSYPQANDGHMMPADLGGNIDSWINYAAVDLETEKMIFRCPQVGKSDCFNPYGGGYSDSYVVSHASYIMNSIAVRRWGSATFEYDPARTSGWCNGTTFAIHSTNLIHPVESIYVCDALRGISSADARGIISYEETDRGFDLEARDTGLHHMQGFNALLGDGHVEHFRQTRPDDWAAAEL